MSAQKPWIFAGIEVARADAEACQAEGPKGYICTRLPKHGAPHVAHVFRETGSGRPSAVVDTWLDPPVQGDHA